MTSHTSLTGQNRAQNTPQMECEKFTVELAGAYKHFPMVWTSDVMADLEIKKIRRSESPARWLYITRQVCVFDGDQNEFNNYLGPIIIDESQYCQQYSVECSNYLRNNIRDKIICSTHGTPQIATSRTILWHYCVWFATKYFWPPSFR